MADRALLVGVGEYRSLPALPAASSDVHDLAEVLTNPSIGGYQVNELTETRGALLAEAVSGFLSDASSDDRQLIYFACHGLAREDDYYLAASDTEPDQVRETALSLKSLLNWVDTSRALTTLIILDICNTERTQVEPIARLSNVSASTRVALIYSSRPQDQYSAPSGRRTIIMKALTDAIGYGGADTNADGVIGIHGLYKYLSTRFGLDDNNYQGSLEMVLAGPDFSVASSSRPREIAEDSSQESSSGMGSLRPFQREAVRALEGAITSGHREVAIEMAVGSGRSAVIATFIYRFINSNAASRVLYLTGRTMLKIHMRQVLSSISIEDGLTVHDICPIYTELSPLEASAGGPRSFSSSRGVYISTIQALAGFFKEDRQSPPGLFDLMIIDDINVGQVQRESAKIWRDAVAHYDAAKVFFSSTAKMLPSEGSVYLAFKYDLKNAVNDGVLVHQSTAVLRAQASAWPGFDQSDSTHGRRRVFLSYAQENTNRARTIANQLRAAGVDAWFGGESRQAGTDLTREIFKKIESHEVFVVLLSPAWLNSPEVREDLDVALERRGIEVIPAIIENCAIPGRLADRGAVDASHDIDGLLRRLQASVEIDFEALNPASFDRLVRELLTRLSFRLDEITPTVRADNFIATYHDAHGFADSVTYVVEVRFAKRDRPSVRVVQRLAEVVISAAGEKRGLLVTSGHLTSIALQAIDDINRNTNRIRVIDGPQLKSLLLLHPDLITKYFRASRGSDG